MNYLSDKLLIDFQTLPQELYGKYVTYEVRVYPTNWTGTTNIVYIGNIYISANGTGSLYLNDIVTPYMFPCSDVKVTFKSGQTIHNTTISQVLKYNQISNVTKYPNININDSSPLLVNTKDVATTYVARYPKGIGVGKLNIGANILFTKGTVVNTASDIPIFYCWNDSSSTMVSIPASTVGITFSLTYDERFNHSAGNIIVTNMASQSNTAKCVIGVVEECPADYYVNWIDRNGAWTCQPFSKKATYTESIETKTRFTTFDEEVIYRKTVTPNWTLNTDWLNDEQYKAYESILVSPQILLYDVKNDSVHEVICKSSQWTEKNRKNTKRLFNLSITLNGSNKQIINY